MGSGLAVLHGWYITPRRMLAGAERPDPADFRPQQRDLYVAAGDTGYWQGAVRDEDDPLRAGLQDALAERTPIAVDVLYADHEGGQRTISRFGILPVEDGGVEWTCNVLRHWRLDGINPREP
ncbi:MAG: hypothetical protein E6G07_07400 [Actinobacteria bacterium]|nr:MAG: hypothetical protein E6G07_07400 [Actinomycetota bacterium]